MAASTQKPLHDLIEHLAQSRDALSATLADVQSRASRKGGEMFESASTVRDNALAGLSRASKTTQRAIRDRPIESAVLIGVVGIAIGWVLRRMQERERVQEQPAERAPRRRSGGTSAASRSRAAAE